MKLIESSVELLKQEPGITGINKMIELAGRTCYKSEDKITEDSAEAFVQKMINSHHTAMLEHGTVYLKDESWIGSTLKKYANNKYSRYKDIHLESKEVEEGYREHKRGYYVTTNLRVLVENGWLDDLKYICEPTEFHERRIILKFTTDRGVSHELVRHRVFSFAQESQRYCNYSKDKYGREITFVKPSWLNTPTGIVYWHDGICWRVQQDENNPMEWFSVKPHEDFSTKEAQIASEYFNTLSCAERMYFSLLTDGCKVQEARAVLPNATKTEICMTGFASDCRHFFDLRYFEKTGKVHPDMLDIVTKAKNVLEENELWDYIMSFPSKFN